MLNSTISRTPAQIVALKRSSAKGKATKERKEKEYWKAFHKNRIAAEKLAKIARTAARAEERILSKKPEPLRRKYRINPGISFKGNGVRAVPIESIAQGIELIRTRINSLVSRSPNLDNLHNLYKDTGYSLFDFRKSIARKFYSGMTWENKKRSDLNWAVDHIIGVKFLADNGIIAMHITNCLENLTPLLSKQNSVKGDFIFKDDLIKFRETVLLPNGIDLKTGWEKDPRIVNHPYWLD